MHFSRAAPLTPLPYNSRSTWLSSFSSTPVRGSHSLTAARGAGKAGVSSGSEIFLVERWSAAIQTDTGFGISAAEATLRQCAPIPSPTYLFSDLFSLKENRSYFFPQVFLKKKKKSILVLLVTEVTIWDLVKKPTGWSQRERKILWAPHCTSKLSQTSELDSRRLFFWGRWCHRCAESWKTEVQGRTAHP